MHHFFEAINLRDTGAAAAGVVARLTDPVSQLVVPIYADNNYTPIVAVSGLTNAARADSDGNFSFFVEPGTYDLSIYQDDGVSFIKRIPALPLTSQQGEKGDKGDKGEKGEGLPDLTAPTGSTLVGYKAAGFSATARTVQAKLREVVSVLDFGADPTGAEDSHAAIQAAFSSGARKVILPKGVYVSLPGLVAPDWLHIEGAGFEPGSTDTRSAELRFALPTGIGIDCGQGVVIKGLTFSNTSGVYDETSQTLSGQTASGLRLEADATIEECSFFAWHKCIELGAGYYVATRRIQFNRCSYGYFAPSVTPYNLHIDAPNSVLTNVFLAGATTAYPRNVKVFGGSVEGYDKVAEHFSEIDFFGTYFETAAPRSAVLAIDPGINGASVGLFGCHINVNLTNRFINLSGLINATLTSQGNKLFGTGPAGGFYAYLPNTGNVSMAGDNFTPDPTASLQHAATYRYVDSFASASRFGGISMPLIPAANDLGAYTGQQVIGARGFIMAALTAAPAVTITGMTVLANAATWNPLGRAGTAPYWTMWNGSAWQSMDGGA